MPEELLTSVRDHFPDAYRLGNHPHMVMIPGDRTSLIIKIGADHHLFNASEHQPHRVYRKLPNAIRALEKNE